MQLTTFITEVSSFSLPFKHNEHLKILQLNMRNLSYLLLIRGMIHYLMIAGLEPYQIRRNVSTKKVWVDRPAILSLQSASEDCPGINFSDMNNETLFSSYLLNKYLHFSKIFFFEKLDKEAKARYNVFLDSSNVQTYILLHFIHIKFQMPVRSVSITGDMCKQPNGSVRIVNPLHLRYMIRPTERSFGHMSPSFWMSEVHLRLLHPL